MKNTLNTVIIALIATIVLSACNSSLSITKRRASKGYFVNYSNNKGSTKPINNPLDVNDDNTIESQNIISEELLINPDTKTIESFQKDGLETTDKSSQTEKKVEKHNQSAIPNSQKTRTNNNLQLNENKTISKIKAKLSPRPSEGGVLSLLWIVIVILIVLWALGFIAGGWGMGGLIHILLLLALILLILWLLRII
jgi:cobalamin biosynthesis Mg chelatase CobN